MKFKKLYAGIAATTAAVGLGGGLALAAWSVSGSGSGGAAATVAQGVTLTAITPVGAAATLYPGGPASSVYFSVSNPNPYAVTISSITWGTPVSYNTTACPNSNFSLSGSAPSSGLTISVPANSTSTVFSVPGVILMSHAAPDGCQGVGAGISMTVSGTQQ